MAPYLAFITLFDKYINVPNKKKRKNNGRMGTDKLTEKKANVKRTFN